MFAAFNGRGVFGAGQQSSRGGGGRLDSEVYQQQVHTAEIAVQWVLEFKRPSVKVSVTALISVPLVPKIGGHIPGTRHKP